MPTANLFAVNQLDAQIGKAARFLLFAKNLEDFVTAGFGLRGGWRLRTPLFVVEFSELRGWVVFLLYLKASVFEVASVATDLELHLFDRVLFEGREFAHGLGLFEGRFDLARVGGEVRHRVRV